MSVSISWTKTWSSSDDGSILDGADLGALQLNIENHTHSETVNLSGTQTVAGDKELTGTIKISGTLVTVFWQNELVAYDNDFVFY